MTALDLIKNEKVYAIIEADKLQKQNRLVLELGRKLHARKFGSLTFGNLSFRVSLG